MLEEDGGDAERKAERALPLLPARKEEERLLQPDEQPQAQQEEDVAHGQQAGVKQHHHAKDKEDASAGGECNTELLNICEPHHPPSFVPRSCSSRGVAW